MSVRLNRLLETALKVSQSILRYGDGLIHGRFDMTRLLICIMGNWACFQLSNELHSIHVYLFYNKQQNTNMVF